MVSLFAGRRYGPIAVDLGSQSVKLLQLSADRTRVLEAARWDLPARTNQDATAEQRMQDYAEAIRMARQGRNFRGREAVLCLGARELFVQNIRVPKAAGGDLDKIVKQEAAGRLPFSIAEAELRYFEAADVRQGEATKREVILLACHKPVLNATLGIFDTVGLCPVAVDVEPAAVLRCYCAQYRRDEDRQQRAMFVHVGASNTAVIIARGDEALFIKYIDVGGQHMDDAVASHLNMAPAEASALRRHNGDRRAEAQDPEVSRSVANAVRSVIDRLASEISMCIRYHSVTFRGQPLARVILGGGESNGGLQEALAERLNMKCELGDPLRALQSTAQTGRRTQWDVATGLALRDLN